MSRSDDDASTLPRSPATAPDPIAPTAMPVTAPATEAGSAATVLGPASGHGARAGTGTGSVDLSTGPLAIAAAGARYALGRVLGRGGMGEVRLARDPRVDRDVAVKVMRDPSASPDLVARFLREARVQGRLDHPAIVPVHDLGVDERGAPYFAMKRLTGTTLADAITALRSGDPAAAARWPRRLLLDRLVDVCLAIEFAHERGVVHRDLKPSNLMLGDYGEAYVLDWGIARVGGDADAIAQDDLALIADASAAGPAGTTPGATPTAIGAMLGTPGYMAPEQMRGERVDRTADIYALGCVLFEILTLAPAIPPGPGAFEATLSATPHHPRQRHPDADVPPELDAACAHATEPEPAARTGSARELAAAIRAYLDGDRDLARRRELAQAHADAATRAWTGSGDDGRSVAMREAGRALAIDPSCADAQVLLGRLLLTPPTVAVPEVVAEVHRERHRMSQAQLRTVTKVYVAFLLLIPTMLALGVEATWPVGLLTLLVVTNLALAWYGSTRDQLPERVVYASVVDHLLQLVLVGILFGPLLVLPTLAIGSIAAFATFPGIRRPLLIVLGHLVAVLVPLALELLGLIPSTFTAAGNSLVIHPRIAGVPGGLLVVIAIVATIAQVISTAGLALHHRATQEAAQDQVHLQTWHLKQLIS